MNATPILPEDDPDFFPSMPTQRGGASRPGEPPRGASAPGSPDSMETVRGRTAPRGERLHIGDVLLGRYTVLSELGQGGMGVVYKCLDNVGGIEVALKSLPPELSRNEAEMEGIRENYAIVARLHHAAISGLRHLEKDPDFDEYYLVMDLAEGEDLSTILRRRRGAPMPPAEALAILRPLASALDYAHTEKVLHRDVKPANVKVLRSDPSTVRPTDRQTDIRVQLLDFGLAAEVRSSMSRVSLRGHVGMSGTPAYMAPEQWEARPQSAATDQYALAVMAYQMLAAHLPFDADDTDLLRRAVLTRAPDPVPGLPRAANAALQRALAKDPAARFPSCGAFVEALGRLAGTARPTTRRFAVAAAVVVAAAGALWFTQSRRGGRVAEGGASPPGELQSEAARAAEQAREEAARKAEEARRAEAERKAREEAESKLAEERKAREEAVRKAEAERKAAEEARLAAERKAAFEARLAAERKAREEAERKAHEEATRKAHEDAERKAREEENARKAAEEARLAAERKNREQGKVQLWAGGPYWATRNIGAVKPEDSGLYFWWGDTVGYRREGDVWIASDGSSRNFSFSPENTPTYGYGKDKDKDVSTLRREGWITPAGVFAPQHDAAHVHWGGAWRMPTKQELSDLDSKCDWTWRTMNGVNGYVVRGRGAYANASIFLPAAGYGNGTSLGLAGSDGRYWSSVPYEGYMFDTAGSLGFYSVYHGTDYRSRGDGFVVRPVQGFAE